MKMIDAIAAALTFHDFPVAGKGRSKARTQTFQGLTKPQANRYRAAARKAYTTIWCASQPNMPMDGHTIKIMVDAICAMNAHQNRAVAFEALGIKPHTGRRWITKGCPRWSDFLLLRDALEKELE